MNNKPYVLVTGASSGIGKVVAINLSERYNIILHGRNEERLAQAKEACNSENNHLIWIADLNRIDLLEDSLKSFILINEITISYYVHCAGIMKMLPLKMVTIDSIQTTFNTNFFSATLITKLLVLKKINKGSLKSIVYISSNISDRGAKAFNTYAASKGALDSLMRCLAVELAPNIRVNSVLPGAVQTEMTRNIFENQEFVDRMNTTYPLGIGRPEDVFEAVAYLLSDSARWITGQQLTVDGGRTINITG